MDSLKAIVLKLYICSTGADQELCLIKTHRCGLALSSNPLMDHFSFGEFLISTAKAFFNE